MKTYTVKVNGMMCGMCEAHIQNTIRDLVPDARKVSASHGKGEVTFISDAEVSDEAVRAGINRTGYEFVSIHGEEQIAKKKFKFLNSLSRT